MCEMCEQYGGMIRLFMDLGAVGDWYPPLRHAPGPESESWKAISSAFDEREKKWKNAGNKVAARTMRQCREALYWRYMKGLTYDAVGVKLGGLSRERVRQILNRAVGVIQRRMRKQFQSALTNDLDALMDRVNSK